MGWNLREVRQGVTIMAAREYKAYLLRLWRESHEAGWRAALENSSSGERAAFATLGELVAFLETKTGEVIRPLSVEAITSPEKEMNQTE
jgi:hypothetical protein